MFDVGIDASLLRVDPDLDRIVYSSKVRYQHILRLLNIIKTCTNRLTGTRMLSNRAAEGLIIEGNDG